MYILNPFSKSCWYVSTLVSLLTDGLNAYNKDTSVAITFAHSRWWVLTAPSWWMQWPPVPERLLRDSGKFIGGPPMPRSTLAWQWACQSTQGVMGSLELCTRHHLQMHPPLFTHAGLDSETQELLRREMCSHSQMGISESLDGDCKGYLHLLDHSTMVTCQRPISQTYWSLSHTWNKEQTRNSTQILYLCISWSYYVVFISFC